MMKLVKLKLIQKEQQLLQQQFYTIFLRKISGNSDIKFDLKSENKLNLITDNSDFNLIVFTNR